MLSLLVLASCGGPDCPGELIGSDPADGAVGVYWRTDPTMELTSLGSDPQLILTDEDSNQISGITSSAGNTLTLSLDHAMEPDTTYTLQPGECVDNAITFTTSSLGTPVSDPSALLGTTFQLDTSEAQLLEPSSAANLLATTFSSYAILAQVTDVTDDSVVLRGAIGVGSPVSQDPCSRTLDLPTLELDNPFLSMEADELAVPYEDSDLIVTGLVAEGTLQEDGTEIHGLAYQGNIDTRTALHLLFDDPDTSDDAMCGLLDGLGIPCEACPDGSGEYCIYISIAEARATRIDLQLEEITTTDPDECPDK